MAFKRTDVRPFGREAIAHAAELIRDGQAVAVPTETVYGLGADIFNEAAVRKIFAAKGRPADNPLIAHISSMAQLESLAAAVPPAPPLSPTR